jgi:hypothetical protein
MSETDSERYRRAAEELNRMTDREIGEACRVLEQRNSIKKNAPLQA